MSDRQGDAIAVGLKVRLLTSNCTDKLCRGVATPVEIGVVGIAVSLWDRQSLVGDSSLEKPAIDREFRQRTLVTYRRDRVDPGEMQDDDKRQNSFNKTRHCPFERQVSMTKKCRVFMSEGWC